MNNQELAAKLLELLGGKENILTAANCMTRLRVKIKDMSKVQLDELKTTSGVMGVVEDATMQIVLGPGKAKRVADILINEMGVHAGEIDPSWEENKADLKANQKDSPLKQGLRTIGNIFIPLIPAIIAAGLLNGIASLIGQLGTSGVITVNETSVWFLIQQTLSLLGSGFLSYFAIFTGVNAAKQFGATEALGGMIGAISIAPGIITLSTFFGWYNVDVPLESILTTGKGGIIGVIFGVWILAKVEKGLRKVVPEILDLIVTPICAIVITGVIFVFAIMPVAGFLSDLLISALNILINSSNPVVQVISGFVLSALFLPMVLLGLHHGLIPIYAIQLEKLGGVTLFPVLAMAGAGQVGAAIAIYIKAKQANNQRLREVIVGALPAGILGVGEPLIYGVTLPMGKPFITAGIGAGFGGAFVMLTKVMATAWGPSGMVAIPLMTGGSNGAMGMLYYFIGLIVAYIGGFIVTWFFVSKEEVERA
ncbi:MULTISPECIES: PTS transporter subunit EIIC [unclassified Breznakia]|uniref:PTS transporter subunit EIIC n=1 Tax=unclassified Breznakia TaxID=2623764 RepID=UPI0024759EC1|nr:MULTISPECIES: PTS transporter subunit EIIC [unclassified Breznakia]MDH6365926.1 PTS system sucrose-specific IIC component [Breznakia sp. PH1-1]MDH6403142.1 PTS system sucrose-specific IIC component [Breznakia sp. PF1-11]MDH6410851.1 PTS system sucrose-specific IIC component [Breznakia sp. PFB1-11]MDH6413092.1 PTS system sucrose-specific IIC component [Breznakia sp. PFB1-14]MDH6415460.1 PTS system sucrose-specific IIC component [Breznakia sp. PFB1-4]